MVYQLKQYKFDSSRGADCCFTCRGTVAASGRTIVLSAQKIADSWHCTLSVRESATAWRWVKTKLSMLALTVRVSLRRWEQKVVSAVKQYISCQRFLPLRVRITHRQLIPGALRL